MGVTSHVSVPLEQASSDLFTSQSSKGPRRAGTQGSRGLGSEQRHFHHILLPKASHRLAQIGEMEKQILCLDGKPL